MLRKSAWLRPVGLITLVALCGSVLAEDQFDESEFDDIDMPEALKQTTPEAVADEAVDLSGADKKKDQLGFGTVFITFCHGCGYARLYNEVSAHLKNSRPDLAIEGSYHEAEYPKPQIAQAVMSLYGCILMLIVFGDHIFNALGMPIPGLLARAKENQMWSMFGVYYLGNLISQNLMNTGAFEITYNGQLVWSKLDSGRLPSWPELMAEMTNVDSAAGGVHRMVLEENKF